MHYTCLVVKVKHVFVKFFPRQYTAYFIYFHFHTLDSRVYMFDFTRGLKSTKNHIQRGFIKPPKRNLALDGLIVL
jgi:hypothetical protein